VLTRYGSAGLSLKAEFALQVAADADDRAGVFKRDGIARRVGDGEASFILHAAKNEAGLNVWKLWVIKEFSFSR
jgi:hypothetical protein